MAFIAYTSPSCIPKTMISSPWKNTACGIVVESSMLKVLDTLYLLSSDQTCTPWSLVAVVSRITLSVVSALIAVISVPVLILLDTTCSK